MIYSMMVCDGDGCSTRLTLDGKDDTEIQHSSARAMAMRDGWSITNGEDLCPDCAKGDEPTTK